MFSLWLRKCWFSLVWFAAVFSTVFSIVFSTVEVVLLVGVTPLRADDIVLQASEPSATAFRWSPLFDETVETAEATTPQVSEPSHLTFIPETLPQQLKLLEAAAEFESASESESRQDTVGRSVQWLVFQQAGCLPCRAAERDFRPWLSASRWQVDDSPQAHVRLIDADLQPGLNAQFRVTAYPTFVLIHHGQEILRHVGYPGRNVLVSEYLATINQQRSPPGEAVGAISIGTLAGGTQLMAQVFQQTDDLWKTGMVFEGKLAPQSAGGKPPPSTTITLNESASLEIFWPLSVRVQRTQDRLQAVFSQPYPQVQMKSWLPLDQSVRSISATLSELTLDLPRMVDLKVRLE